MPEAETKLIKADLATEIIRILDARGLSARDAAKVVGVNHSDISRIRNADLRRFTTIDRLVTVLHRLDKRIEVRVVDPEHEAAA